MVSNTLLEFSRSGIAELNDSYKMTRFGELKYIGELKEMAVLT